MVTIAYYSHMKTQNLITEAINTVGLSNLARACKVSHQAVRKWEAAGRLPRTEWTGETNYAQIFEFESNGRVTRDQLLQPVKAA